MLLQVLVELLGSVHSGGLLWFQIKNCRLFIVKFLIFPCNKSQYNDRSICLYVPSSLQV